MPGSILAEPDLYVFGALAIIAKVVFETADWLLDKDKVVRRGLDEVWTRLHELQPAEIVRGVLIATVERVELLWSEMRWRRTKLILVLYGINLASALAATYVTDPNIVGRDVLVSHPGGVLFFYLLAATVGAIYVAGLLSYAKGNAEVDGLGFSREASGLDAVDATRITAAATSLGVVVGIGIVAGAFSGVDAAAVAVVLFAAAILIVGVTFLVQLRPLTRPTEDAFFYLRDSARRRYVSAVAGRIGGRAAMAAMAVLTSALTATFSMFAAAVISDVLPFTGEVLSNKGAYPPIIAVFGALFDTASISATWALLVVAARAFALRVVLGHLLLDVLIAVAACCWLPLVLGVLTGAETSEFLLSLLSWTPGAIENNRYFLIVGVSAALPTFLYGSLILAALAARFTHRVVRPPVMFLIFRFTTDETPVLRRMGTLSAGIAGVVGAVRILLKYWGT